MPVTVIVLPAYADVGTMDVAVGEVTIASAAPATDAATLPFMNDTCTNDATASVPGPMTTTAAVALTTVQDAAAVPEPGVGPTRALHAKPGMKLVPVTVMVLPAYADVGNTAVMMGRATIWSGVPLTVAAAPPFSKINFTDDFALGVLSPITTMTVVALATLQDVATLPKLA